MTEPLVHRFPWGTSDYPQVWIVHFGSKSTPLIAQHCRELGVRSRILNADELTQAWFNTKTKPKLVILSGGHQSVYEKDALTIHPMVFDEMRGQIVVLGICYGAQLAAKLAHGIVLKADTPEYGEKLVTCHESFGKYKGGTAVMNHGDEVRVLPDAWYTIASTEQCRSAFFMSMHSPLHKYGQGRVIGVQFHPEMDHTEGGNEILEHVLTMARVVKDYSFSPEEYVAEASPWIKEVAGDSTLLCGLSGGVDSGVALAIARRAIPNIRGVFVDTGCMRKGEADEVRALFGTEHVIYVDASELYYSRIEAVKLRMDLPLCERIYSYYEDIRKAIGSLFYEVFADEARKISREQRVMLLQGTNAADAIESKTGLKTHHNMVPPEARLNLDITEPLNPIYKSEIRQLGVALGLPEEVAYRQPFPGPGLALRAFGTLSREIFPPLRDANAILEEVVRKYYPDRNKRPCQYYVAMLQDPTTGLMGDARTIGFAWWVRMVWSRTRENYATLSVEALNYDFQTELSQRLTSETRMPDGTRFVRVGYELTGKPPSTTELH